MACNPGIEAPFLIVGLDHVEWDARDIRAVAEDVRWRRPMWLRVANFFERTLEVLRLLAPAQLVLWKLEFWGTDTPYDIVPASAGVDPARFADELLALGHHVVPYTFVEWNRGHLLDLAPTLRERGVRVLPLAQKPSLSGWDRERAREAFGIGIDDHVFGAGGLMHPTKGIEEVVDGFVRTCRDPDAHLLCSLVDEDGDHSADGVRREWLRRFGDSVMDRVHVRVGGYGDWAWMSGFYQAVDVMCVNSVSDSWGRMVSEPLGFGVPTVVRRARCATNHLAPGLVLVDGFENFATPMFTGAVERARRRSATLARYVEKHYGLPVVRKLFLELMRSETPPRLRLVFNRAAADPRNVAQLNELMTF